jgi:hypothetical protein
LSDSRATSQGIFGGRASSVSDAHAETFGGLSTSQSRVHSDARYHALAESDGLSVSHSGFWQDARSGVRAESRSTHSGQSRASAVKIQIRR